MINERVWYFALFVAEALIAWLYLEFLFNSKKPFFCMLYSFALGYVLLFLISFFGSTTTNALFFYLINYILIRINYQCNIKSAVLHSAFLCFIMVSAEILVALFISLFGYEFSAYTNNFHIMVLLIILSKLLYLVFSVIGSRIFTPHKQTYEEPHFMILFCGFPVVSATAAVLTVYFGMTAGIAGNEWAMTIMFVVMLLIMNLIIGALYHYFQKSNAEYLTLQLSLQREQADVVYYRALQEQFENQRILVHDTQKHFATIAELAKQSKDLEIEQYISSIGATLAPIKPAKLCSDPILNLVLLRFRNECEIKGVLFHCDVRESISTFMDASSITTLYGNLLSNALDAAYSSTEKQIELSVTQRESQPIVILSVVNSCDNAPISDGIGGYRTTKSDMLAHGVWLKCINRIIKKYRGISTMYYNAPQKQFHYIIQFPLPQ